MAFELKITDSELQKSAVTYRKELLIMPVISAMATLQHMTARPGVAGREVLGQLSGGIELGPYDPNRKDDDGLAITPRKLETYLGSVIKRFDMNSVAKTVYGALTTQGDGLASLDLTRQVLNYLAMQLGRSLNLCIFSAVRNESGTLTKDLFDGFDTITQKEVTAGTISQDAGNFIQLGEAITESNAVDTLMKIYEQADDSLQGVPSKMFVPFNVYRAYNKAVKYLNETPQAEYMDLVIEKGGSGSALASTAVNILNAWFSADEIGTAVIGENQLLQ